MKRNTSLILLLSFSVLVLINYSCDKDSTDDNYYVKTGVVTDQATGKPVSGALVYYGYRPFGEYDINVGTIGQPVLSGADGRYKISILKSDCDKINPAGQQVYKGQLLYAKSDGYTGSNIISSNGGVIIMYQPAEVQLHVKNDTINNKVDNISMWIEGSHEIWGYPGFKGRVVQNMYSDFKIPILHEGRFFDSTFVLKELWGNLEYTVKYNISGPIRINLGPGDFSYKFTPVPGSVSHFDVSF